MKKGNPPSKSIIYFGAFIILMIVEVYIAIFIRDNFFRPYVGDILAVIVLYFFVRTIRPKGFKWLLIYIFLFSVCIEITQYFQLVQLLGMTNNRVISIILGGTFDWSDILCYGIGCVIVWGARFASIKNYA